MKLAPTFSERFQLPSNNCKLSFVNHPVSSKLKLKVGPTLCIYFPTLSITL